VDLRAVKDQVDRKAHQAQGDPKDQVDQQVYKVLADQVVSEAHKVTRAIKAIKDQLVRRVIKDF
jgi:hypothetical protein